MWAAFDRAGARAAPACIMQPGPAQGCTVCNPGLRMPNPGLAAPACLPGRWLSHEAYAAELATSSGLRWNTADTLHGFFSASSSRTRALMRR